MNKKDSMDWCGHVARLEKDFMDWEYYSRRGLKLILEVGKIYFTKDKDALLILKILPPNKRGHKVYRYVNLYSREIIVMNEFMLMSAFFD